MALIRIILMLFICYLVPLQSFAMIASQANAVADFCNNKRGAGTDGYLSQAGYEWINAHRSLAGNACDSSEPSSLTGWCQIYSYKPINCPLATAVGTCTNGKSGCCNVTTNVYVADIQYGAWQYKFTGSNCAQVQAGGCASSDNVGICDKIDNASGQAARAENLAVETAQRLDASETATADAINSLPQKLSSAFGGYNDAGEWQDYNWWLRNLTNWTMWNLQEAKGYRSGQLDRENAMIASLQAINKAIDTKTNLQLDVNELSAAIKSGNESAFTRDLEAQQQRNITNAYLSGANVNLSALDVNTKASNSKLDGLNTAVSNNTKASADNAKSITDKLEEFKKPIADFNKSTDTGINIINSNLNSLDSRLADINSNTALNNINQTAILQQLQKISANTSNTPTIKTDNTDVVNSLAGVKSAVEANNATGQGILDQVKGFFGGDLKADDLNASGVAAGVTSDLNAAGSANNKKASGAIDSAFNASSGAYSKIMPKFELSGGCALDPINVFGKSIVIGFCGWMDILGNVGMFLLLIAYVSSVFIIMSYVRA